MLRQFVCSKMPCLGLLYLAPGVIVNRKQRVVCRFINDCMPFGKVMCKCQSLSMLCNLSFYELSLSLYRYSVTMYDWFCHSININQIIASITVR